MALAKASVLSIAGLLLAHLVNCRPALPAEVHEPAHSVAPSTSAAAAAPVAAAVALPLPIPAPEEDELAIPVGSVAMDLKYSSQLAKCLRVHMGFMIAAAPAAWPTPASAAMREPIGRQAAASASAAFRSVLLAGGEGTDAGITAFIDTLVHDRCRWMAFQHDLTHAVSAQLEEHKLFLGGPPARDAVDCSDVPTGGVAVKVLDGNCTAWAAVEAGGHAEAEPLTVMVDVVEDQPTALAR